jgi:hypothetical protein
MSPEEFRCWVELCDKYGETEDTEVEHDLAWRALVAKVEVMEAEASAEKRGWTRPDLSNAIVAAAAILGLAAVWATAVWKG